MSTIKELLNAGPVRFSFRKKDGSVREAYGTRNVDIVNEHDATPKGTGVEAVGVTRYYDLDKNAWRCFLDSEFIEVLEYTEA